jgi:uncharacterized protein
MTMPSPPCVLERATRLPFAAETVFAWHERPGALERLTPQWEHVRVIGRSGGIEDGASVVLQVGRPLGLRWVVRHRDYVAGRQFADEQVQGPFARWVHLHRFEPDGPSACIMTDRIEYTPPLGSAASFVVRPRLERVLAYRHELLRRDIEAHERYADREPLRVAVTGASGLIGRALVPFLTTGGHHVTPVVRSRGKGSGVRWDYETGRIDAGGLEGMDAVVHLAGENVGARWTRERRRRIMESRVIGTRFLAEALTRLRRPPRVLISASAVGIYGNRGDEVLTEASPTDAGPEDLLTEVGRGWEAATEPARVAGIRTVAPRFGIVLTPAGGALGRMLTPFRLGLGGPLGNGRQWMSWIGIDDVVGAIHHALMTDSLAGAVNLTSPHPATGREFATTLARVLGRPALLAAPAPALRLVFGEMADVALLSSTRVLPARLEASGYEFRHPELEAALRFLLGRGSEP